MLTGLHSWLDQQFVQDTTSAHLILAMLLGTIIGIERQWRQRTAGLRTTVLVCIGAASFVDLAATVAPSTTGTTQVIAYVVSGVGFLGAGAIMREGLTVRGLNTAATLWCSAAVGASAGVGEISGALATTIAIIFINSMVRPIVQRLERRKAQPVDETVSCSMHVVVRADAAPAARGLLLAGLGAGGATVLGLSSGEIEGQPGRVELRADVTVPAGATARVLEPAVERLDELAAVISVRWRQGDSPAREI
ncbi:MAG: MgtC/SapB family protein [Acetobacteraceae bacterium]